MPLIFLMDTLAALSDRVQNWPPIRAAWRATTKTTFRVILTLLAIIFGFILIPVMVSGQERAGTVILFYWLFSSPFFFIYSRKLTKVIGRDI